ncbi:hypothetical protein KDJ56_12260 [Brevibacillus composti]|uniref:Helicase XPB/Ssl2 N-terminal domain-containing protein n=1 Tax=Brevibacillus composti TaxID=2796470 RepID=A0A7T5EHN6_9BACL|nr:hypothetical protein [Brevibacillus composti]QQE72740.1 hypothetical protein JD108_12315 [Brevibacillus composti]QUO39818.1 hypothetical protein KDJ56_12260 [Brevibacillus composti]
MNLAEIMVYTDIRQLHQMASHYGCECNPNSKNELITTLLSNLRHKGTIAKEIEQLSREETHFFLLLFLDKRTQMSLEDLLAKAGVALEAKKERKQEEARTYIAKAMKRGWIFPAKTKAVGQYQVPHDIREPLLQAWLLRWQNEAEPFAAEPEAYRDEGTALVDDIMQFLQFLQREPVPLTADGSMYKRYQQQLLQFLQIKEEPLAPQRWRFGYGLHFDLYPDRFSLIYDFCYYQRWIEEVPGQVMLTEAGLERLQTPSGDALHGDTLYHEVIRFWMRLYKRAIPNLPMLVQLIPMMASQGWVSQREFSRSLLPWIRPFYYDEPQNILVNRILKMMVHLGLIRVGQVHDGEWIYSGTYASQSWLRKYNGFTDTTILLK